MIFRSNFSEEFLKLEEDVQRIHEASEGMRNAPQIVQLLKLILMLGNFMNSTGAKGGAHAITIGSINKVGFWGLCELGRDES